MKARTRQKSTAFDRTSPVLRGDFVFTAFIIFLPVYLKILYRLPILQTAGYYLGAVLFLLSPGRAILRQLKWDGGPFAGTVMAALTGMAATPIFYFLCRIAGLNVLFIAAILLTAGYNLFDLVRSRRKLESIPFTKTGWIPLVAVPVILVLLHFSHWTDWRLLENGDFRLRSIHFTETIHHLGIINVVEHTVPPFYPYLSGYNLAYHIDMHLFAEMFSRFCGVEPPVMTYYFLPFTCFLLIVFVPAVFFLRLHPGQTLLALLCGLLIFGADLSFLPALWKDWPEGFVWTRSFKTTIWSLFTLNGLMPAVPLFFGAALAYQASIKQNRPRYLVLFTLLAYSAYRMKSSMGLQVAACAAIAALFTAWHQRCRVGWKTAGASFLVLLFMFADHFFLRPEATEKLGVFRWNFPGGFIAVGKRFGWDLWVSAGERIWGLPLLFLLLFAVYFACFMGVRVLILKYVSLPFKDRTSPPVIPFLLVFVFSGILLSESLWVGGRYSKINNGGWFAIQSVLAATYFVPAFIASLPSTWKRLLCAALVLVLSFPTTVQFLMHRSDPRSLTITAAQMEAVRFMKKHVPPDAVVLYPTDGKRPSLASHFAGRQTVLSWFRTFIRSRIHPDALYRRISDVSNFFSPDFKGNRTEILERYRVDFILMPARPSGAAPLDSLNWAEKIFQSSDVLIYRIHRNLLHEK